MNNPESFTIANSAARDDGKQARLLSSEDGELTSDTSTKTPPSELERTATVQSKHAQHYLFKIPPLPTRFRRDNLAGSVELHPRTGAAGNPIESREPATADALRTERGLAYPHSSTPFANLR